MRCFKKNFILSSREALILLKLKQGSAILLREIVSKAVSDKNESSGIYMNSNDAAKLSLYNAKNSLKEFGIAQLGVDQAKLILNLRSDFVE